MDMKKKKKKKKEKKRKDLKTTKKRRDKRKVWKKAMITMGKKAKMRLSQTKNCN